MPRCHLSVLIYVALLTTDARRNGQIPTAQEHGQGVGQPALGDGAKVTHERQHGQLQAHRALVSGKMDT